MAIASTYVFHTSGATGTVHKTSLDVRVLHVYPVQQDEAACERRSYANVDRRKRRCLDRLCCVFFAYCFRWFTQQRCVSSLVVCVVILVVCVMFLNIAF